MDLGQLFIGVVAAIVGGVVPYWLKRISDKIDAREAEREQEAEKQAAFFALMQDALKAVLRDRLLQARRYHVPRGYIPAQEFENISALYKAYAKLGGNDLGHKAYEELKSLPFEAPLAE